MNWLHKINPSKNNETNCFNILKLNLLATGYSDMARSLFIIQTINYKA